MDSSIPGKNNQRSKWYKIPNPVLQEIYTADFPQFRYSFNHRNLEFQEFCDKYKQKIQSQNNHTIIR